MALNPVGGLHFLRPMWLAALPVLWLLATWLASRGRRDAAWSRVIEPPLLAALRLEEGTASRSPWPLVAVAWTLAVLALAGPTWRAVRVPATAALDDWVFVLDLSPSMDARDIEPSRVVRARYALDDLLAAARDARVALVVYAGEAHVVTPLTTDVANVQALLPPLTPALMPESGHQLAPALEEAARLLRSGGSRRGTVIVLTDDCLDLFPARAAAERLRAARIALHIVGIGSERAVPESADHGEPVEDAEGRLAVSPLDRAALQRVAAGARGDYRPLAALPSLIATLRPGDGGVSAAAVDRGSGTLRLIVWRNEGYWLLVPLLLVVALLARRGWL